MRQIESPLAEPVHPTLQKQITQLMTQIENLKSDPTSEQVEKWAKEIAQSRHNEWETLNPTTLISNGGSTLTRQDDLSILAGGANPQKRYLRDYCFNKTKTNHRLFDWNV